MRTINDKGLALIKEKEGFCARAYHDSVGILTIGYGFTKDVHPDDTITLEEAEARLKQELSPFERVVNDYVKVIINDNQFSALVVFTYNVGANAFKSSTLLKIINLGFDRAHIEEQFLRWNKIHLPQGYEVSQGLTNRRKAEIELYYS